MNKPPAFQFYADDFISGTAILTTEETGAYILMLCHQWNTGGVPNDDKLIKRIAKITQAFDLGLVKSKFELVDGVLKNSRMEAERMKQFNFRAKQAENGAKGGRPNNPSLTQPKPKPNPDLTPPSPSPVSNKNNNGASAPVISKKRTPTVAGNAEKKTQPNAEHGGFIAAWHSAFRDKFDFPYEFDGGRDGKAVKELLATSTPGEELLSIARDAWCNQKSFACKQASTIHGFRNYLNQIRVDLKPVEKFYKP